MEVWRLRHCSEREDKFDLREGFSLALVLREQQAGSQAEPVKHGHIP